MATKNLARTVIEGGRCGYYKSEVRQRAREERAESRDWLRAVRYEPDLADEDLDPRRTSVSACFADKLRPIYRFLDSNVGQRWNDVRSELFSKFDTRTTPGRHVLFDHLLRDVREEGKEAIERRYARYFVDEEGFLHSERRDADQAGSKLLPSATQSVVRRPVRRYDMSKVAAWLGSRKVGKTGAHLSWFVPARRDRVVAVAEGHRFYGQIAYVVATDDGVPMRRAIDSLSSRFPRPVIGFVYATYVSFRQDRALTSAEEEFFRALPQHVQNKLLEMAPV